MTPLPSPLQKAPFWSLIEGNSLFSVDIFDTLLFRLCKSPADTFRFMQEHSQVAALTDNFTEYRIAAEAQAREDAAQSDQEEVSLDEIYTCLTELTNCTPEQAKAVRDLELQTETMLLQPTNFGLEFVEHVKATGKRYIVTSDMYLPQDFLENILLANGISGWERVLVSNAQGRMKHSGTLYRDVIEHFDVPASKLLHIGDNPRADGKKAEEAGLQALIVPSSKDLAKRSRTLRKHSHLFAGSQPLSQMFISQYLETHHPGAEQIDVTKFSEEEYLKALGSVLIAPVMTSLMIWFKAGLDRRNIENVSFLARDGMFPKAAFELIWPDRFKTSYIAASRRLLFLPFSKLDADTIHWMFRDTLDGCETLTQFFEKIAAGPQLKTLFEGTAVSKAATMSRRDRKLVLETLKSNPDTLYASFEHERDTLISYYSSVFPANSRSAVFDVGWNGSLQRSLSAITHDTTEVVGYYFGTSKFALQKLHRNGLSYESYSVENGLPQTKLPWVEDFRDIVEFFCSADHGSVLQVSQTEEGEFVWHCADVPQPEQTNLEKAQIIQSAALSAIAALKERVSVDTLETYAQRKDEQDLRMFLQKPHREDALRFKPVRVFAGVGDTTGVSLTRIGDGGSHYRNVKRSKWRAAYGAQLGGFARAWVNFRLRKRKDLRLR